MLEAVYVDVPNKKLVAFQVKPAFKPLFRVSLDRKEPQLLSARFGHSDIVSGDPEGIRGPHAQWAFAIRVARAEELLWAQSLTA